MRVVALGALALLALAPSALDAQRPAPRRPVRQPQTTTPARTPPRTPADTLRARRDSAGARDTSRTPGDSARPELVQWAEPDSVMQELLARPGYSVTRYQGAEVVFDAEDRSIDIVGGSGKAAVRRDQTVVVSDTITYNDSTQVVRALGDTIVLRDPSRGPDDVVSYGHLLYEIGSRRGQVADVRTAFESGNKWFIQADRGAFVTDSSSRENSAFYGRGGSVTSCDETRPHYHFESRELKLIRNRVLVSRPAVLYIYDVPVFWLPFVFQDLRSGRRSGMLTPRFGVSELVRNSPTYRRHFENFGYYFAFNDFMDAQASVDWRSSARPNREGDPGFIQYNAEWRYRWLDRFMGGRIAASHLRQRDDSRNLSVSWAHQQDFSQSSHLTLDANYASDTRVQRANEINPFAVLATIQSRVNYQQQLGPLAFSAGGSRRQYPGRDQIDQDLPNISISSSPINVGSWLTWTPTLSANNSQSLDIDQGGISAFRFRPNPTTGLIDSLPVKPSTRTTSVSLGTPLRIFGFDWRNSVSLSDVENDFPDTRPFQELVPRAGGGFDTVIVQRLFEKTYKTGIDWQTGVSLPSLFQGTWNLTPSVEIVNATSGPFIVRSERTGDRYVRQSKRLQYGASISPTFFGLFPGIGPVSRFRHAITPTVSYRFAPAGNVSDEYLAANGDFRSGYLGDIRQNAVSLSLNTNIEAKLRSGADTSPDGGRKIRLLSIQPDGLTYNFERIAELRRRSTNPAGVSRWAGLETQTFGYSLSSDLLPGFSFRSGYSLFQGDVRSDTAEFKPYRESLNVSFSINRRSGILAALSRVFGKAVPLDSPGDVQAAEDPDVDTAYEQAVASQPVAGSASRNAQFDVPSGQGFQSTISLSSTRQRPVRGGNVVQNDPTTICRPLQNADPISYEACLLDPRSFPQLGGILPGTDNSYTTQTTSGGTIFRNPPLTTLQASTSFNITPKWAAQWATSYDVREKEFGSHIVTLQRELHDWRAVFSFTQAPSGAFAFTFFIALNAQPDLKFNYDRRSYGRGGSVF